MENNTELKSCPFCGGQAKLKATTKKVLASQYGVSAGNAMQKQKDIAQT